ncbi:unnamed protein product [Discosporangium mesarthrocarpum]
MSLMVESLFSGCLELFVPCPNATNDLGINSDKFIPNPRLRCDPTALSMFEFTGRIMGVSLRTHLCLPFQLPSVVWSALVGRTPTLEGILGYDALAVQQVQSLRACEDRGVTTQEEFEKSFGDSLSFVSVGADGSSRELVPGGASITVTLANRMAYCNLIEKDMIEELQPQIEAMCRGMTSIVPSRPLHLFTWDELETLVCGSPSFDIDLWRSHTKYGSGYTEDDITIKLFWKVLSSLTPEEQSGFVRFAWGRSRLPPKDAWTKDMQISRRNTREDRLPVSHTCFFSVELPPYQTEERMRHGLLTAIVFGSSGILNI